MCGRYLAEEYISGAIGSPVIRTHDLSITGATP